MGDVQFKDTDGSIHAGVPKTNEPDVKGMASTAAANKRYQDNKERANKRGGKPPKKPHGYQNFKSNPNAWYEKYPELFEVAATLGFNHIKGKPILNVHGDYPKSNTSTSVDTINDALVLAFKYITTPGYVRDESSGFMMQFRKLYLALRRKYRGLNSYQVGDLAITLWCVMEFYRYIAKLERIYGVCSYYNAKNRIMPVAIPAALKFNYDDLREHLADFRYGINALITRAKDLCLPTQIDVLNRWFLLESNIFKDAEGDRASYIIFDDDFKFYTYQSTALDSGGAAILTDVSKSFSDATSATHDELLKVGADMLGLLLEDDDITLIMSDLVAAFADANGSVLTLEKLPEDYVVTPVYNEDVLLQVHNANVQSRFFATAIGASVGYDEEQFKVGTNNTLSVAAEITDAITAISQNTEGSPIFQLTFGNEQAPDKGLFVNQTLTNAKSSLAGKVGNLLLDTWKDKPTASDIMEMTRFTVGVTSELYVVAQAYYHRYFASALGSEMLYSADIYYVKDGGAIDHYGSIASVISGITSIYQLLDKVDWHPMIYDYSIFDARTTVGNGFAYSAGAYGDLDNCRVITVDVLDKIHDAAIMSLFDVSSVKAFK